MTTMSKFMRGVGCALLLFGLLMGSTAHADPVTATWNTGAYDDWSQAIRWDIGLVPNNTGGTTYSAVVPTARSLYTSQNITIEDFTLNGGLWGDGILTVNHSLIWGSGTLAGKQEAVLGGGDHYINPVDNVILARSLVNNGTVHWNSNGSIYFFDYNGYPTPVVTNSGTFIAGSDNQGMQATGANVATFNNDGLFLKDGGGTTFVSGVGLTFNNTSTGTVRVQSGVLSLGAVGTSRGGFDVRSGAALRLFASGYTVDGGTFSGPGSVIVDALLNLKNHVGFQNMTVNRDMVFNNNATLEASSATSVMTVDSGTASGIQGTGRILTGGTLNVNTGTIGGAVDVVASSGGVVNWVGGNMVGTGTTTINSGATLNLNGAVTSLGRTLVNNGTTVWSGSGSGMLFVDSTGVFDNRGLFSAETRRP